MNSSNYGTLSVAQHVFALLLEITNRINLHNQSVKNGDWGNQPDFCYTKSTLERLEGKKMGIIGFGAIGQAVASIATAFGMHVQIHSRSPEKSKSMGYEWTDLEKLVSTSDVISLHIPSTSENKGMLNGHLFQKMKEGSILINTARGELINELDLYNGLLNGKPAFAALDVLKIEPPVEKSPLFELPNCLITPHIAWASKQSREKLMSMTAQNLENYLTGKPINNLAASK